MIGMEKSVSKHYGADSLFETIQAGLRLAGKDVDALIVDDLAPIDAFHSRGRESTTELVSLMTPESTDLVLDVGCGLGGSARYLADHYTCQVWGIDLTPDYIDVAKKLTELVGLSNRVNFQQASALELPFGDAEFDLVWTEHAQMNIAAKDRFYGEIARVLKPGGRFLFHDIFGGEGDPTYPLPWAEDESISSLATEEEAQVLMKRSGLRLCKWVNKVEASLEFFDKVLTKMQANGPPPIGIHLLMGDNAKQKLNNYVQGMNQRNLSVALGVVEKPP